MIRRTIMMLLLAIVLAPAQLLAQSAPDQTLQKIVDNPDLLNDAFAKFRSAVINAPGGKYDFMRNLDLKFKTFQTNGQQPALGFEYAYDNSWTKRVAAKDFSESFNLNLNGNVAFRKIYNPDNFLVSKFTWNISWFFGGHVAKNTKAEARKIRTVDSLWIQARNKGDEVAAAQLWQTTQAYTKLTNQFYIGSSGSFAYESNQDFSRQQFAPGILVNIGVKPWDRDGALRWFNLPDYPFAFLRYLTGTDEEFQISRAAFPSAILGIDHVVPEKDSARKAATGKLDAFNRFRLEAGYKTKAAVLGKQVIWFSADYRWYRELNASSAIIAAKLDQFHYFTCNLASNNGFFVSFTRGKLPFDIKDTSVYGIGFNYNLGNWK